MSSSTDLRLQRLLGGDHFALLRKRLRRRFERAPLGAEVESFRLGNLTTEEHAALTSLLGRPLRYANSLQVDVRLVDAAFRNAGIASSLRDALERLDGPITNLARRRFTLQTQWSDVLGACANRELIGLLQAPAGIGLLKRLSRQSPIAAAQLCHRVEVVLQRLPASGITRSQLAAEVLGDAHALDSGQPTATLVLAVWRQVTARTYANNDCVDVELTEDSEMELDGGAERDRDVWAKAGVLVNELARPALFLNLPVRDDRDRLPGEPIYASLRSLLRSPPPWDVANRKVYVCENPNLVAIAADRWGSDCAPLVCTDGMPAAAQRCLLSQLAKARAQLCYHGDFDWPGIRIGNHVMREHGAQSWRFCAADYEAAVDGATGLGQTLTGKAVHALWDEGLMATMQRHRLCVAEEALAASLLEDLKPP
ncbi:TIGR02679 family protein [Bradyrhizobium erythrophlei]|uniref:TIGR02679 family protein n=1 Tax=Bradyrhizobium erythrophlei TaxID=1437360 RepID=UPI0035EE2B07